MSDSQKSVLHRYLRRLLAGCGWIVFLFEWFTVSYRTPGNEEVVFVAVLVTSVLLVHLSTWAWITHNKRLARIGGRGRITRYNCPRFSQDHLGRELVFEDQLRQSNEIVVSIVGTSKVYCRAHTWLAGSGQDHLRSLGRGKMEQLLQERSGGQEPLAVNL